MIVVAIIGVLAGIAIPAFKAYRERAQVAVCVAGIRVIEKAVISFAIDESAYPDSLADVGLADMRDPWGNPYQYLRINGVGKSVTGKARKDHFMVPINTDFDLYSMGPDGKSLSPLIAPVSRDDIIRANDGLFVGRASLY
jgi:general secretion pathway protein G